ARRAAEAMQRTRGRSPAPTCRRTTLDPAARRSQAAEYLGSTSRRTSPQTRRPPPPGRSRALGTDPRGNRAPRPRTTTASDGREESLPWNVSRVEALGMRDVLSSRGYLLAGVGRGRGRHRWCPRAHRDIARSSVVRAAEPRVHVWRPDPPAIDDRATRRERAPRRVESKEPRP